MGTLQRHVENEIELNEQVQDFAKDLALMSDLFSAIPANVQVDKKQFDLLNEKQNNLTDKAAKIYCTLGIPDDVIKLINTPKNASLSADEFSVKVKELITINENKINDCDKKIHEAKPSFTFLRNPTPKNQLIIDEQKRLKSEVEEVINKLSQGVKINLTLEQTKDASAAMENAKTGGTMANTAIPSICAVAGAFGGAIASAVAYGCVGALAGLGILSIPGAILGAMYGAAIGIVPGALAGWAAGKCSINEVYSAQQKGIEAIKPLLENLNTTLVLPHQNNKSTSRPVV